jgi:membrane associated rhomboid family serine protease
MGIYDREYYRGEESQFSLRVPQTIVVRLILINVALWLLNGIFFNDSQWLSEHLAVKSGILAQPWEWYRFLTYGFVHDWSNVSHLAFNMLALFIFGLDVEMLYGRREFLRLYLVLLVAGSLVWAAANALVPTSRTAILFGASGAVVGTVILFCLHYPRRTILLMFVLPVPAWVLGVLMVGYDVMGALGGGSGPVQTAVSVHLTGAALAFLYFHFHWNFGRLFDRSFAWLRQEKRSPLRVFKPPVEEDPQQEHVELKERVDQILEKIYRQGESSLTRQERHILETASREYQRRRGPS